jgi:hypothetical protein
MRESEIADRNEKYVKKKPIPRNLLVLGYILIAVLLLFTLLTKNHLFLFLFLAVISTVINYETGMATIHPNFAPEVFSSLLIAKLIGFHAALLMLIVPTFIVDLYTARLDKDTLFSNLLTLVICFVMATFNIMGFLFFGILLVTVRFVVGLLINLAIDISPEELLFEHVVSFIANILLFLVFGNVLLNLFA